MRMQQEHRTFIDAMNWGVSLIEKKYIMPDPDGAAWDWIHHSIP